MAHIRYLPKPSGEKSPMSPYVSTRSVIVKCLPVRRVPPYAQVRSILKIWKKKLTVYCFGCGKIPQPLYPKNFPAKVGFDKSPLPPYVPTAL